MKLNQYICKTCGTEFTESANPPDSCPVCKDERQFVGYNGQEWTTMESLQQEYSITMKEIGSGVHALQVEPSFAIGQRALLVQTDTGNMLWDCIPLINNEIISRMHELGGIDMIAVSHPHFYSAIVRWSRAFDNIPVYLHQADKNWVMRPDNVITFWNGRAYDLTDELILVNPGGHFDGGTILYRKKNGKRPGAIFTGDIIHVVADRQWVSFMYSFPNLIPLPSKKVQDIADIVCKFQFDEIYGAWDGKEIHTNGNAVVRTSADRYSNAIREQ